MQTTLVLCQSIVRAEIGRTLAALIANIPVDAVDVPFQMRNPEIGSCKNISQQLNVK
jgi:hypothetical protein